MNRLKDLHFQLAPSTAIDQTSAPDLIAVGIDPGETTGVAVYSKELGLLLFQTTFWELCDFISEQLKFAAKTQQHKVEVVIESPQFNSFQFSRHIKGNQAGVALKIARNVGMNQGDAKRITQHLRRCGIEPREYAPTSKSQKWTPEFFKGLSGIDTLKTHEHCRDAARMISEFWIGKINNQPR